MAAEQSAPQPLAPEISFPVEYQKFAGREYNRDLKGSGTFSARADLAEFRFTGRSRKLLKRGIREANFAAGDISNVVANGNAVKFTTTLGQSGKLKQPFIFFCRDASDSSAIVRLLPNRQDADFTASREFFERLQHMARTERAGLSVTNILIGVNVAVFIIMAGFLGCGWLEATDLRPYIRCGASNAAATADGEWWRLVTCMFIHFGILHLALNMWALFQTGQLVERLLGKALYTLTYFGAGLAGGLLSLVWNGDKIWSAGASGAIFGVYGALLGYMLREKHALPRAVLQPLMRSTLLFAGYNLLYGLTHPGIDNAAHVGGIAAGIVFGWICAMPLDPSSRAKMVGGRFLWATLALIAIVCLGVYKAPRYPYVLKDELAWGDATKEFIEKEPKLLLEQSEEIQRWQQRRDGAAGFAPTVEIELEAFYADFAAKIGPLPLTPGRLTDRRRNKLVEFLKFKAEGFKHLERAMRENDQGEFQAYSELETKAEDVIRSMAALKG